MKIWKILAKFLLLSLLHQVKSSETKKQCTKPEGQKVCSEDVEDAFRFAMDYISKTQTRKKDFSNETEVETADISSLRRIKTDSHVHYFEKLQEPFEIASNILIESNNITDDEKVFKLPHVWIHGIYSSFFTERCKKVMAAVSCDPTYRYRTVTGECNNLEHSERGSVMDCYQRLLKPYYVGTSGFRLGMDGNPLPDPRSLTLSIHRSVNRPWKYLAHMYVFFGQLLANDIAMTPITTTEENKPIQCCPSGNQTHPQCAPVEVLQDDPFYSQHKIRCLNFVRSSVCPTCKLGVREQMNQVTAFIDASFVYGNSNSETISLRQFGKTGKLKVQNTKVGDLLPRLKSRDPSDSPCVDENNSRYCFLAGDPRVNQHSMLAILHTLFVREHNRIAHELVRLNPTWEGEKIFQEARRIVGAEMQAITYNEFLPITLGETFQAYFKLRANGEARTLYDKEINPSLFTEFTTAAFRYGHTLINSMIAQYPQESNRTQKLLRDDFFQPFGLYEMGEIEYLLTMAVITPPQAFDQNIVADVSHLLFKPKEKKTGLDLAAIDIQRGRDHGLPPYVEVLNTCASEKLKVENFEDLMQKNLMSKENMLSLKKSYRHVMDIDLWTGILSEAPLRNAVVGPTAACVIGLQFYKLKFGDRFYFEHEKEIGSFTDQQIQQLKKTTLSMIICSNSDVREIVPSAMLAPNKKNKVIPCTDVPRIDLSPWKIQ